MPKTLGQGAWWAAWLGVMGLWGCDKAFKLKDLSIMTCPAASGSSGVCPRIISVKTATRARARNLDATVARLRRRRHAFSRKYLCKQTCSAGT
ncbi:hypothetical protein IWZ03DRAFT_384483 [Phyllosticta citriasiana]|uniref:Lipoprotein n=1 Tax=Phyllosticta citriasiana TaxID=595635 RepID=A0ABR1KDV9_9PEZI